MAKRYLLLACCLGLLILMLTGCGRQVHLWEDSQTGDVVLSTVRPGSTKCAKIFKELMAKCTQGPCLRRGAASQGTEAAGNDCDWSHCAREAFDDPEYKACLVSEGSRWIKKNCVRNCFGTQTGYYNQ